VTLLTLVLETNHEAERVRKARRGVRIQHGFVGQHAPCTRLELGIVQVLDTLPVPVFRTMDWVMRQLMDHTSKLSLIPRTAESRKRPDLRWR
jgi:hypothetical protein